MSIKDELIGAKGGGGSFKNTPDNLRSTDTFEALIGLTSGRIKGLAPGGLRNLFVDDIPIEDGSGNTNLSEFVATLFDGDPTILRPVQLLLGGSSGASGINLPVNNPNTNGQPGEWRNGTVSQIGVDFIDLRFIVNQLYQQDKKGIYESRALLEINLQPSGSTEWINPLGSGTPPQAYDPNGYIFQNLATRLFPTRDFWDDTGNNWNDSFPGYLTIRGKTISPFVKEIRLAVPNTGVWANKSWNIRVRLIDRDSYTQDENEERRTIVWESAAGVTSDPIGDNEAWRGLAYLHIHGKATDQLTGIPTVTGIYDLAMVRVPPVSVWDAETQTYTGATWDGATEEIKWTRCPAFQMKDLVEDGISGISALVPGSTLNKWDALEASKWFAERVPDGQGGTQPRYTMNYILDQALSVTELMQYVSGAVGAYAFDQGDGQWRLLVDKPENAVAIFTKENVVGEFVYSHTDVDSRFNDITGVFRDETRRYEETRVRVFDQDHIDNYGRNHQTISLVGCTNRQEALRRLKLRQLVSLNETRMVNFTTNRQGRMLSPLSVILIADQDLGPAGIKTDGRLVSRSGTTLTVRDNLRLEVGVAYKIHVTVPNPNYSPLTGTQPTHPDWAKPTVTITRNVVNTAGQRGDVKTIYIDADLPANTPENAPIAFEAAGLPTLPKQYRVLSVEPADQGELMVVNAVEIYTPKWDESDNVDEGEILAQQPERSTPSPEEPEDGMFSVRTFDGEYDTVRRLLTVSWVRPGSMWINGFKVEYQLNDGSWQTLADRTQDTYVELAEPTNGNYRFRVYTLDRRGGVSAPLVRSYELDDLPDSYAPTNTQGPLADRPVAGARRGNRYTTTDQAPNITYVWDGEAWWAESNYVDNAGQITYTPPSGGPGAISLQDLGDQVLEDAENTQIEQLVSIANQEIARIRDFARMQGEDGADVKTLHRREVNARLALAVLVTSLQAQLGGVGASVEQILQAMTDGEEGFARFLLRAQVDEDGVPTAIVGMEGIAGEGGSFLRFMADLIEFINPETGLPMLEFDTATGKLKTTQIVVDEVEVGSIRGQGLDTGALGASSIFQNPDNVSVSTTSWINIASVTMTPLYGKPVEISFSCFGRCSDDNSTDYYTRLVRDDGTPIRGGSAGRRARVDSDGNEIAWTWVDGSERGRATTWTVQARRPDTSETAVFSERFMRVKEDSRIQFQNFSVTTTGGEGPTAGTGGGGPSYNPNLEQEQYL